jgi:DNA-binding NarL/FixJ family response regulator
MPEVTVAIVEDQRETREGLAALIAAEPGFRVMGPFASMEEALARLTARAPDVLLSDITLPGLSGTEGLRRLKAAHPDLLALMLTVHGDDQHIFEAVCAGASGYLLKDTPPDRLVAALRELVAGGAPMSSEIARKVLLLLREVAPPRDARHGLTPRELDVLQALADGHSYKTAARALALSIDTVRFHVRAIYAKLHVHSKSEAVVAALKRGIVS